MIFDKGPASLKEFSDREFSEWVNNWLEQLETTGDIKRDYDDFRSYGESQATIQREVREAYDASFKKKEGVHYAERGQGLYLLDEKTNMIKEGATALWLEAMKRSKLGHHAQYKYIKVCVCVFGKLALHRISIERYRPWRHGSRWEIGGTWVPMARTLMATEADPVDRQHWPRRQNWSQNREAASASEH